MPKARYVLVAGNKRAIGISAASGLALALLLVAALALASLPAYASSTAAASEPEQITREYSYRTDEPQPQVDESVTEAGQEYQLVSVSEPEVDASFEPEKRVFTRETSLVVGVSEFDAVVDTLPESIHVDEGSFVGDIPLTGYVAEPTYRSEAAQADRSTAFYGLPDNDARQIPGYYSFWLRSDSYLGAEAWVSLRLLDVVFERDGGDPGRPVSFTAYATYRGVERWLAVDYFDVTATYEGEVASSVGMLVIKAVYEHTPPPLPVPGPVPGPTPGPDPSFPLWPIVWASAALLSLALLLIWLLVLRFNIRLVRHGAGGASTVAKARVSVSGGEAVFRVPDKVMLEDGSRYSLHLKPRLASQAGVLAVLYRGRRIMEAPLAPMIRLDMTSLMARMTPGDEVMQAAARAARRDDD